MCAFSPSDLWLLQRLLMHYSLIVTAGDPTPNLSAYSSASWALMPRPTILLLLSVSAPELPLHWLCVLPHPFLTTTRLQAPPAYPPPTPSFHFLPPSPLHWMEARNVSPLSTLLPIVSDHSSNSDAVLIPPFEHIQQRAHHVASYSGGGSSFIPL